ncbi:HlyD family efflux transporter periplasmic adaptor subunit [Silvanigrella paludirubra]|uniref:HlyD family efflux transporter periplasmic adaptor subunit n=1 Tax=Silvanigrella paludirubra TaxID=2499159 RepID=A0A6N6VY23_9BACT|nr:HlyD family secretion protein [Silvanigrella paludirubra]KAB8041064.1 HlyD family efflux transporter periplasmic adaptor subunit [Silvanigrella paludirubra]
MENIKQWIFKSPNSTKVFFGILISSLFTVTLVWFINHGKENTDDSQIVGHIVTVSPRISGQIAKIFVENNQSVKLGDILVELDSAKELADLESAEAEYEAAKASYEQAQAQHEQMDKNFSATVTQAEGGLTQASSSVMASYEAIKQARANLNSAMSAEELAKKNLERYLNLKKQGAVTQFDLDNQQNQYAQAKAARESAQAQLGSMEASRKQSSGSLQQAKGQLLSAQSLSKQVKAYESAVALALAKMKKAEAELDKAKLQLSYTQVKAPFAGVTSNKMAELGQLVESSTPLFSIVSLDDTWLVANFKEDQLQKMKPGQNVKIKVDSYPGKSFQGIVRSLSGASGSTFALLPPDNASGNFIKVTQRFPVEIDFQNRPKDLVLRPGMSTEVTVITK